MDERSSSGKESKWGCKEKFCIARQRDSMGAGLVSDYEGLEIQYTAALVDDGLRRTPTPV